MLVLASYYELGELRKMVAAGGKNVKQILSLYLR